MLYVVGTPIGNLGDITYRAIETLNSVDVILCEDTRQTMKLCQHYSISKPLESYHAHTTTAKHESYVKRLVSGETFALVSDAGTPGISDPGVRLIADVISKGVEVVPIPGASACITALMTSGVPTHEFWYVGFLPAKKGRQTLFETFRMTDKTIVSYESKHRLMKTLEAFATLMPDRTLVVAKELTKLHERFVRGTTVEVLSVFQNHVEYQKGEFVLILAPLSY